MTRARQETLSFVHDTASPRIVFGSGSRNDVSGEVQRLGLERVLVVTTGGRTSAARDIADRLGRRAAGVFEKARRHVPRPVLDEARAAAERVAADGYLTIGGGSAIGLAKALALADGAPIVAVPTTYAGSEVTPIWGITDGERKLTGRDPRVLPRTVIYDPELTIGLPPEVSGASGMNAIAHCVEAMFAADASPVTLLAAEEGLRRLTGSLQQVAREPENLGVRSELMYGSYLAGMSLAGATMGTHHRLCHLLGGAFDLPHAETHAVLLPVVVQHRSPGADLSRIARAIGSNDVPSTLFSLRAATGAPGSLRSLGLSDGGLRRAIKLATGIAENGGTLAEADARAILEAAHHGRLQGAA